MKQRMGVFSWAYLLLLPLMLTVSVSAQDSIGVVALVNPEAELERTADLRAPEAGEDVFLEDRMQTGANGQIHLMLVDKSSFTIGPNSDITIDRFVYDPDRGTGDMALSAVRGVMRFVGGDISKQNPVEIQTSIGTLGIRGGIALISIDDSGAMTAIFSFGTSLSFEGVAGGSSSLVTRPGFQITVSPTGEVSAPVPADPAVLETILGSLEADAGGGGTGAPVNDETTQPVPDDIPPDVLQAAQQALNQLIADGAAQLQPGEEGEVALAFNDEDLLPIVQQVIQDQLDQVVTDNLVQVTQEVREAINILVRLQLGATGAARYSVNALNDATIDPSNAGGVLYDPSSAEFRITGAGTVQVDYSRNHGMDASTVSFDVTLPEETTDPSALSLFQCVECSNNTVNGTEFFDRAEIIVGSDGSIDAFRRINTSAGEEDDDDDNQQPNLD